MKVALEEAYQAASMPRADAIAEAVKTLLTEADALRGQALRSAERAKRLEASARKLLRRQPIRKVGPSP